MNLQEIETLLNRYFEGDTSPEEEVRLSEFFASGEVPEQWNHFAGYFGILREEKERMLEDPEFDRKVMAQVQESKVAVITDLRRPWIYWIAGVAASVLILLAIFVKFDPFTQRIEDTYSDPQVAYNEAKKILLFVSAKLNQGTRNLEPVTTLETGLSELKPVGSFTKAIDAVNRLDNVDKVEKLIINN